MSSSRPSVRAAAVKAQWSPPRVLSLKRTTVTVLKTVTGVYGVRACHHTALVCAVSRVTYGSVQNDLNSPPPARPAPRVSFSHFHRRPGARRRARGDARRASPLHARLPGGAAKCAHCARPRLHARDARPSQISLKSSSIIIHIYQTIRTTDHRPHRLRLSKDV